MKDKLLITLFALIIILCAALFYFVSKCDRVANERDQYASLTKSYSRVITDSDNERTMFRMRIEDLETTGDSLIQTLDSMRREIGIRDKRLKSMHHRVTFVEKTDTVYLSDSIFISNLDTILTDGWVSTHLKIEIPNKVSQSVSVKNQTDLFVSTKKETVNPPRKFFLFRLFQRKHLVITVVAKEGNPWCRTAESRHVEIVD